MRKISPMIGLLLGFRTQAQVLRRDRRDGGEDDQSKYMRVIGMLNCVGHRKYRP